MYPVRARSASGTANRMRIKTAPVSVMAWTGAVTWISLFSFLADDRTRTGARVGENGIELAVRVLGVDHHALGDSEAHFARGEVRDDDDVLADERSGVDRLADAREDLAGLAFAEIEDQADQLVGTFDG